MSETKWLTKEAYDRLQAELDKRKKEDRIEIARRIDAARREGDLKENGGYHAARNEQSLNETRIAQLEALLKDAQVGETPPDDGVVEPGMVVQATINGVKSEFLLATREAGEGLDIEVYSPEAPLGKALIGHTSGETVSYKAPSGKQIKVKIGKVHPYRHRHLEEA